MPPRSPRRRLLLRAALLPAPCLLLSAALLLRAAPPVAVAAPSRPLARAGPPIGAAALLPAHGDLLSPSPMDYLVSLSPTGDLPSSLVSGGARNPSPSLPPMDGAGEMATGAAAALPLPATKARGRPHPPAPSAAQAAQWRPTLSSLRGVAHDGPCCYGVPPWRCFSMRDGGRPPPSRAPATASSVRCSDHAMDLVKVKVQSRVGERRGVRPHRPKIVSKRSTPAQGCTPLKDKFNV